MDSFAPRSVSSSGWTRAGVFLLAACFAGHAFFLARHAASSASGSGATSYFNSARLGGQWRQIATVGQATFWQLEPPPGTL